jgi:hypothetical protein
MNGFKKFFIFSGTAIVVLFTLVMLFFYYANYSEGYRAGTVMKVSKKGYIFKTYEGELNVEGLTTDGNRMPTSVWNFSVLSGNEEVLKTLEETALAKQRVKIEYEEKFVKFPWRGETKYFVTKVEILPN